MLLCRREAVKSAAWEVRSQDLNLKKLAGERHNRWSLRLNWTQLFQSLGSKQRNAGNLTTVDSIMIPNLKGLDEALSGGAWPSTARAVRCRVKSRNERDPRY